MIQQLPAPYSAPGNTHPLLPFTLVEEVAESYAYHLRAERATCG